MSQGAESELDYPETARVDHQDEYHGTKIGDPYRWLEEDVRESERAAEWVKTQNEVTLTYLHSLPYRDRIEERLTKLWNYERFGSPFKRGGRYYFYKNDGLQNQDVLYLQNSLDAEAEILMDPNTWSADGTVALSGTVFSDDGRYVAYGVAEGGSDWRVWRVMEIESRKVLDDKIEWIKFGSPTWTKDGKGFFYSRFKEPQEGAAFQSLNFDQTIYYHQIGSKQSEDQVIYRNAEHPEWGYVLEVSEDGNYLIITVWKGTDDKYLVFYRDLTQPGATTDAGEIVSLVDTFDYEYTYVGSQGTTFYFKTNLDAPKGRVIAIDVTQPQRDAWREIISPRDETLRAVSFVNHQLIAQYLKDAKSEVQISDVAGKMVRAVELPGIGSAGGFGGRQEDTETFYTFSSFATPPSIYHYDLTTGTSKLFRQSQIDFNPDDYEVRQVFYKSKDGTRIPMFLAHRKGLKLDGSNPTLLYGYGGFNIPMVPSFSVSRLAWMEMGGLFAMPNLRGGGEYGESWHQAGTKLNKQNVFDDFIAAAEWLIDNKYTAREKLAIQGRSNGGLLVGACMTQRPDLYAACLPGVGVMDMLRFHQFTAGRYWVDDYGSADDPTEFQALLAYSPYHNIKPQTKYPATMVTTADTDDRVVPGHSFKFAAALQAAQAGDAPVIIRIETRAGHGAGTPVSKLIEEVADAWAFLASNLGMEL
ncbi:MAG: S9 family peptidase [Planctomycetales bacterium]|nr:S9 family peptidase [Planctomycetales bacterium]